MLLTQLFLSQFFNHSLLPYSNPSSVSTQPLHPSSYRYFFIQLIQLNSVLCICTMLVSTKMLFNTGSTQIHWQTRLNVCQDIPIWFNTKSVEIILCHHSHPSLILSLSKSSSLPQSFFLFPTQWGSVHDIILSSFTLIKPVNLLFDVAWSLLVNTFCSTVGRSVCYK